MQSSSYGGSNAGVASGGNDRGGAPAESPAGGRSGSGGGTSGAAGAARAGSGGLGGRSAEGTSGSPSGGGAGTSDDGGAADIAGATGAAGSTTKGTGTPDICTFQIDAAPSSTIPTVGVVDWTTDLAGLSEASIEFTLDDPAPNTINTGSGGEIDVNGTTHRALLLGLKAAHTYTYRIVAKSAAATCTSADQTFTAGDATNAPTVKRTVMNAAAQAHGFIVTSGGYRHGGGWLDAYVIDADGDVVWWAPSPSDCSRATMDWQGQSMWMVDTNPSSVPDGSVRRVGMDGTSAEDIDGLSYAHHDLTVLPDGTVAFLVWGGMGDSTSDLVERASDGTLKTVAHLDTSVFGPSPNPSGFHANSLRYHPSDDTYTVSDLYAAAYVKLTRDGQLLWELASDCSGSRAPKCAVATVGGNHGHQLLDDGHFLYFSANIGASPVFEFALSEDATSLIADQTWSYEEPSLGSDVLGDVQRLPNGDTLVDYCHHGEIHEVSPAGDVVQILKASAPPDEIPTGNYPPPDSIYFAFGYLNFRETLYGAPPY